MLLQIKNRRGLSVMIGYVLLVTFVIILGVIVYQWMKTYVPRDEINCPDGVSIFIQDYTCGSSQLILDLKNNGKFNIGGYFIYATDSEEQELATIDLSQNHIDEDSRLPTIGVRLGETGEDSNSLIPNEIETETFDLSSFSGMIYSIEIVPIRWQVEKNRNRLVSCKDAKIRETIDCAIECTPDTTEETCAGIDCGTKINNCNNPIDCGDCSGEDVCNLDGQCVPPEQCTDTCESLGWVCDEVCGEPCGECSLAHVTSICDEGSCVILDCDEGWENCDLEDSNGCEAELNTDDYCANCDDNCTASGGICVDGSCGSCDGVWSPPEYSGVECDGDPLPAHCIDCACEENYLPDDLGGCELDTSNVGSCASYCALFSGFSDGTCQQNPQQCIGFDPPGTYVGDVPEADETFGNSWCNLGNADTCCCLP